MQCLPEMVKAVRKAWAALGVEVKRGSVAQTMAKSVSSAFQVDKASKEELDLWQEQHCKSTKSGNQKCVQDLV